jgi:hypothetical protein
MFNNTKKEDLPVEDQAILESWCFSEVQKILLHQGLDFAAMLPNKRFVPLDDDPDQPDPVSLLPLNQAEISQQFLASQPPLNLEQEAIFNAFRNSYEDQTGKKTIIIDAPGGTGKSFLLRIIQHYLLARGKNPCIMSWAGIAASLYSGGRTVHNVFSLKLDCTLNCNILITSPTLERRLRSHDVFIMDEAPTTPRCVLEAINTYLQDLHGNHNELWGGKHMILAGDGRQTSPVLQGGSTETLVSITIQKCGLLRHAPIYYLTKNMRILSDDQQRHREWVLRVGNGLVDNPAERTVNIPFNLLLKPGELMVDHVYPKGFVFNYPTLPNGKEDERDLPLDQTLAERSILCPTNEIALQVNETVLKRLEGPELILDSNDALLTAERKAQVDEETELRYPPEILYKQTPNGMPAHSLSLKEGAVVILLRNIRVQDGLCNGTRLRFLKLHESKLLLKCRILTGPNAGKIELIPRMDLDSTPSPGFPFILRRRQFPVRLAYAMTINKSQGQTFKICGVYLPTQCFAHGQFYVAVSRCSTAEGLRIDSYGADNVKINRAVNIVLPQLLRYGE